MRARFVPPQRAALGCEARAWENETRLHARNMNASFDRIDSRGKDVEPTANLVGSFSKRAQHLEESLFRLKILVHFYERRFSSRF